MCEKYQVSKVSHPSCLFVCFFSGAKDRVNEVFTVLINYLDNPNSDPTVRFYSFLLLLSYGHQFIYFDLY